jgi:hypothetical protein
LILQEHTSAINADTAQQAIAAVFRHPEYQPSQRRTLLQQIIELILDFVRVIARAVDANPNLKWSLPAAALLVLSLVLARFAYRRRMSEPGVSPASERGQHSDSHDPWLAAHSAAQAGRYLEAAHALYFAVLQAIERRDRIVIDSAKTVGDYVRDLRRSNSVTLPLFRDFARVYQPVVWGSRECDPARFDHMAGIASQLTGRSS